MNISSVNYVSQNENSKAFKKTPAFKANLIATPEAKEMLLEGINNYNKIKYARTDYSVPEVNMPEFELLFSKFKNALEKTTESIKDGAIALMVGSSNEMPVLFYKKEDQTFAEASKSFKRVYMSPTSILPDLSNKEAPFSSTIREIISWFSKSISETQKASESNPFKELLSKMDSV